MKSKAFIDRLDGIVSRGWAQIREGNFWRLVESQGLDRELCKLTLQQIYHYTKHNSINQAVAAYGTDPQQMDLLRFVYRHANEELGHEQMVVTDVRSLGLDHPGIWDEPPLPPTQALISYLYYVALELGAIARLGYSYWAEDAYDHIGPLLFTARRDLGLSDRNMTFFVAHSKIDAKHSVEVREMIERHATTEKHQDAVAQVAETSLYLTGAILDGVAHAYRKLSETSQDRPAVSTAELA